MNVNERMKELRITMGITQEYMAFKLKIGRSTLSGYETGRRMPDLDTLCQLADFFEVTTDYLLGRE